MIKYKPFTEDYAEDLKLFCEAKGINYPERSIKIIAVDSSDMIVGVIGLEVNVFIEPLISDNPIVANNLFRMAEGLALGKGLKNISAVVSNPEIEKRLLENDFVELKIKDYKIWEKKYYG